MRFSVLYVSIVGKVDPWVQLKVFIVLSGRNTCFSLLFTHSVPLLFRSPSSPSSFLSHLGFQMIKNMGMFGNIWPYHFHKRNWFHAYPFPSCSRWLFLCQAHEREQLCDNDGPLPTEVWELPEQCADLSCTGGRCALGGTHTRQPG